jgi:hypothetical protein
MRNTTHANDTNITVRLPAAQARSTPRHCRLPGLPACTLAKQWLVKEIMKTEPAEKIISAA